jgi:DNA polymerase III epsilon subunit-like protein
MIIAVFDFESTDKDPLKARITELGVLLYNTKTKRIIKQYSSLLWNPTYPLQEKIVADMTGIYDEDLQAEGGTPQFELAKLSGILSRAEIIVGHNIRKYDLPLLKAEAARYEALGSIDISGLVVDTRFDVEYPAHIQTRKLTHLAAELGLPTQGSHSALADCLMTLAILNTQDLDETIARARIPEVWIRADVAFQNRNLAKERKYTWDGENKWWVKEIKANILEQETKEAPFPVIKLYPLYDGPKS